MNQREDDGVDQALAGAGDGAFAVATDGLVVLWNRAAENILGYTAREAIGQPCCEIFAGRDESGNRLCYRGCHVMALIKMGDPVQSFDMQTRTKTGRSIWLNVSTLVMTDGHGGPLNIHLFRDVSATKDLLKMVRERLVAPPYAPTEAAILLTRRELAILHLLADGADTKTAADRLHVSPATVRNHVQNILGKLGVHSRLQAVAYATSHRLLS